jgi:hypothetical protein
VRCTGSCAKAWPPLIAKSRTAVPKKVVGIKGTFGVVRRPDGELQVTFNRLPVYAYAHEGPNQVLCDNVDGWFVVRLSIARPPASADLPVAASFGLRAVGHTLTPRSRCVLEARMGGRGRR